MKSQLCTQICHSAASTCASTSNHSGIATKRSKLLKRIWAHYWGSSSNTDWPSHCCNWEIIKRQQMCSNIWNSTAIWSRSCRWLKHAKNFGSQRANLPIRARGSWHVRSCTQIKGIILHPIAVISLLSATRQIVAVTYKQRSWWGRVSSWCAVLPSVMEKPLSYY